ncbi:MAG TPA: polysaccharide biosynthesis tyrosine autokinase, partial [Anaeromyxobacter sp.]
VLALAMVLGLGAGIAGVFLREALKRGAEDADDIETGTGLAVYATVPHSDAQLYGAHAHRVRQGAPALLAAADPGDIAVEHLRSLRTALQFALVESTNNVIAIGGAGPGVGKSFISANLAYVLASADHRVLLVDCDLRRGRLHRAFGLQRRPGVTDVVSGSAQAADAVRKTENPYLDLLTTGAIPPNPSELLATGGFEQLLGWASRHYAYVVIDTPPVLAVTDPTLVARRAGVNLLVLRAGQHPLREIALAVNRYAQSGVKVQGAVLNDGRSSGGRYGKYGRYSRYEYRSDPRES